MNRRLSKSLVTYGRFNLWEESLISRLRWLLDVYQGEKVLDGHFYLCQDGQSVGQCMGAKCKFW